MENKMVKKIAVIISIIIPLVALFYNLPKVLPSIKFSFTNSFNELNLISIQSSTISLNYEQLPNGLWLVTKLEQSIAASNYEIDFLKDFITANYNLILVEKEVKVDRLPLYGLSTNKSLLITADNSLLLGFYTAKGDELFVLYKNNVYRAKMTAIYQFLNYIIK
jgi:hypothetical protein